MTRKEHLKFRYGKLGLKWETGRQRPGLERKAGKGYQRALTDSLQNQKEKYLMNGVHLFNLSHDKDKRTSINRLEGGGVIPLGLPEPARFPRCFGTGFSPRTIGQKQKNPDPNTRFFLLVIPLGLPEIASCGRLIGTGFSPLGVC
ncbi:hypothetical protein [Negadavirga shengliensis]|uniref:Uncharacterized protein n=1 Tax=Negadavirga shengliensis TaxID=1389218 RepID=A0ABV9T1M1_9BACT